jgi:hypothetical protein
MILPLAQPAIASRTPGLGRDEVEVPRCPEYEGMHAGHQTRHRADLGAPGGRGRARVPIPRPDLQRLPVSSAIRGQDLKSLRSPSSRSQMKLLLSAPRKAAHHWLSYCRTWRRNVCSNFLPFIQSSTLRSCVCNACFLDVVTLD